MKNSNAHSIIITLFLLLSIHNLFALSAIENPPTAHILKLAEKGHEYAAAHGLTQSSKMIIVDFSQPSSKKRLWVYDFNNHQIIMNTWVAHGKGSGLLFSSKFSNSPRSHASAIGFYETGHAYTGRHGYSLKLIGLEKKFNDLSNRRAIIIHPASYVSKNYLNANGRMGRSWGCFAINKIIDSHLINLTKDGALLMAYYPNDQWLQQSDFLN